MEKTSLKNDHIPSCAKNVMDKDPVAQLHEVFGKVVCSSTLVAGVHNKCCFKVTMIVNEKCFSATGTTLKLAKTSCAVAALEYLSYVFNNTKNIKTSQQFPESKISISDRRRKSQMDNKDKNLKALQNVTNFLTSNSNLKTDARISHVKNITVQSKSENLIFKTISNKINPISDLGGSLRNKLKTLQVSNQLSTIDLVNEEVKICIKSFARNPIQLEDPNPSLSENVNHFKENNEKQVPTPRFKRTREDSPESVKLTTAKKKATAEINTLSKLPRINLYQQCDNELESLNELLSMLRFILEAEMGSTIVPYFMVSTMVGGRKFFGHGKTKQLAKEDAAKQILNCLKKNQIKITYNDCLSKNQTYQNSPKCIRYKTPKNVEISSLLLSSHLADIIQAKIMQKFDRLTYKHEEIREYKVLAGIVMTFNMNFERAKVVSIATGTKCVNGGNICCNGSVLNDSHAEIIAKRGLMKFLYAQLRCHCRLDANRKSIFQRNSNGLQMPYSLKSNIHFHLYINTAPCGDARVFNFIHNNMIPTPFNNVQHGQLRTKVEGEMGTSPVGTNPYPQTWDGVVLGERLRTMSCSDKIARWNVVGIQGALLSQLVKPIYLHSIILGSMFNDSHMYRAICGRIQHTLGHLPQPYRLNRPSLGRTSRSTRRFTNIVPSISINWTLGDRDVEIISSPSGRKIYNETSLLSKQAFFFNFYYLCTNLPNLGNIHISNNYAEAKENAKDFQKAKREAISAFYRAELGIWIKKPIEQNEFTINFG